MTKGNETLQKINQALLNLNNQPKLGATDRHPASKDGLYGSNLPVSPKDIGALGVPVIPVEWTAPAIKLAQVRAELNQLMQK